MAEVGTADMPPVETRHVRTVAVLLEEDMPATITEDESVALVGPALRGHAMVTRAEDIVGISLNRHGHIQRVLRCHLSSNTGVVPNTRIHAHLVYHSVEIVEREDTVQHLIAASSEEQRLRAETGGVHTTLLCHEVAIVVESYPLVVAIDGRHEVVPLVERQLMGRLADDLPTAGITTETETPEVAYLEGKTRVGRVVDIAHDIGVERVVVAGSGGGHHGIGLHRTPYACRQGDDGRVAHVDIQSVVGDDPLNRYGDTGGIAVRTPTFAHRSGHADRRTAAGNLMPKQGALLLRLAVANLQRQVELRLQSQRTTHQHYGGYILREIHNYLIIDC